jgi:sigma-E factor negative regulatory protein RseC
VASEEGIVTRIDPAGAWVKTVRGDCCESCTSKSMCHTMGGGKEMEVPALNAAGARVGDRVVLKMNTAPFLKATFLVYLFPVLLLVVGATVGEWLARSSSAYSPLPAALAGFGSLAIGLIVMKLAADRLARRQSYRPRIVRVIGRGETHGVAGSRDRETNPGEKQ